MTSREAILSKLRAARAPFPGAPPRPANYLPVTSLESTEPDALLERFTDELTQLNGEVYPVDGEEAARAKVLDLLKAAGTKRIAAWHFKHIPIKKLYTTLQENGYTVDYANIVTDDAEGRAANLDKLSNAGVGLTGVDAAAAATGTLIVSTGPGKSRLPTALPPVHIAVMRFHQLVPRIEDWLAAERAARSEKLHQSANLCFITGPSRTADIEMNLVLGVHGPKQVQIIVIR